MVKSKRIKIANGKRGTGELGKYRKLLSLGKVSSNIVTDLYNPIDATNRFINLALQTVEEGSQNRQFLLDSKSGLRQMSLLLRKLSKYAKRMEEELYAVLQKRSGDTNIIGQRRQADAKIPL